MLRLLTAGMKLGRTGAGVGAGVIFDQCAFPDEPPVAPMAQPVPSGSSEHSPGLRSGTCIVELLTQQVRLPADAANPVLQGVVGQVTGRAGVLGDVLDTVRNPPDRQRLEQVSRRLGSDMQVLRDLRGIASGDSLQDASPESLAAFTKAAGERGAYEATKVGVGLGASTATALAFYGLGSPVWRALGHAVKATGLAAAGKTLSATYREGVEKVSPDMRAQMRHANGGFYEDKENCIQSRGEKDPSLDKASPPQSDRPRLTMNAMSQRPTNPMIR